MQVISVFIAFLAISRLATAQSQSGYNYPSPFNQLTPGAPSDLGSVPGSSAQQPQPTPYAGTAQPAYNNQQYTPSGPQGPPAFGATPGFNQQSFGQPTATNLPASGSHASIPSHSSAGFGPSPSTGFPSTAAPSSPGFEPGFQHSGGHSTGHSGGHSPAHPSAHSGSHSGSHPTGHAGSADFAGASFTNPSFQEPSFSNPTFSNPSFSSPAQGFSGPSADSGSGSFGAPSGFGNQGAPGFSQGQPGFGGQANNFGQSGGNTQFQGENDGSYSGGDYSAIPGTAGVDYPIYTEIPKTSFDCKNQQFPGYYADVEAQCQVFHICALNTTFNFLCPNGTIFSQEHLVCVWWNQFDCNSAPGLYGNNAYIYDYSKTGQQSQSGSDGNNYDGAQGSFGGAAGSPGFVANQPGATGFGQSHSGSPSTGFGAQSPSTGFGPSSASAAPGFGSSQSNVPGFGSHSSGAAAGYPSGGAPSGPGFAVSQPGATGFGSSQPAANIPSVGFGQPAPSHSPAFGQAHIPSSGSSHTSTHNVPSGHSFPTQSGAEQYPIAPPSQTDYQSPAIAPTIPSSAAPFGVSNVPVTGYPAAGTPSPINNVLTGEQPSREYLPSRRT